MKEAPAERKEEILRYMHCRRCGVTRPEDTAMRDWARLSVGFTNDGEIQVWCARHDQNVFHTGDMP